MSFGLPAFTIVGLPDVGVRESRDRVRSAIRNSGFEFPPHHVTVNLAPADLRKAGSSFDLPIAIGVLAATGSVARRDVDEVLVLGELSLDGGIQLGARRPASRRGRQARSISRPAAAAAEPRRGRGRRAGSSSYPVRSLADAVAALNDPAAFRASMVPLAADPAPPLHEVDGDFADVHGQALARRALEIAAAGGHNTLMVGPPGSGKTMMARRVAGILPPLVFDEALEVTSIHSVAGLLAPGHGLITRRPFRAPHHTISDVALVGGGQTPRPGKSASRITACCFSTRWRSSAATCSRCFASRSRKGRCESRGRRGRLPSRRGSC